MPSDHSQPATAPGLDDDARLDALRRYNILDTGPEPAFDDIARLASRTCRTPIALVSLVDDRRQWFKARVGTDLAETPVDDSFCIHALRHGGLFVVPDARLDPRFRDNALVTGTPGVRFYAGTVLVAPGHVPLGALCVMDRAPRPAGLATEEAEALEMLGRQIIGQLELRRTVGELGHERAQLRAVLDSVPVGLVFGDAPGGRITGGNELAERIFGHPILDTPGIEHHGRWIAFHPDGRPVQGHEYPLARAILHEETSGPEEYHYQRGDGIRAWITLSAAPVRTPDGRVSGGVVAVQDVDAARTARDALRESELRLRAITETMPQIVWSTRPDGHHDYYNQRWYEYTGTRPGDTDGEGWAGMFHPDDQGEAWRRWRHSLDTGDGYEVEYRLRRADGAWRWFLGRAEPVRDEADGAILRWFGTCTDIDDAVHARETLRRSAAELEALVAERTAALEASNARLRAEAAERGRVEESLRQSQKMEAVGQLTGGVAHDFNNMLTGIVGSLELMRGRIAQGRVSEADRLVLAAMTAANRAAALTHRLLAFSRRQTLDPKPTDVNKLVRSMEELVRRTCGEAIRLECVTAGGLWRTLCDANQLENALLNLALNARDAMPDGGVLEIETSNAHLDDAYVAGLPDVRAGQYVCLAVTDTGIGMVPEVAARVFEPFFTTKPLGQGTGLGLSMVFGFVKQSGGHVRVYSEPGAGTTVKLYLPRHRSGAPAEDADTHRHAPFPAPATGVRVLVVEDDPTVRMLVLEVLEELGYGVLEATDGPAGLRAVEAAMSSGAPIDLLITDVGLPGMNGRQLADAARRLRPELEVLFITGYAHNAAIGNGVLDPGMHVISKPFALHALAAKIRALTGQDAAGRA